MTTHLLIGMPGIPEIILIALVALLFFGGKKIPELMRGLGKGVSEFKKGVKEVENEIKSEESDKK
jgi:sec-independent protein translocase protein TatA